MPLGRCAIKALTAYLEQLRPRLTQAAPDAPCVFVSRAGAHVDSGDALDTGEEIRASRWPQRQGKPAHFAAQLCDAFIVRRRRPAHRARAARSRQHSHDATLHSRRPRPPSRDPQEVSSTRVTGQFHTPWTPPFLAITTRWSNRRECPYTSRCGRFRHRWRHTCTAP